MLTPPVRALRSGRRVTTVDANHYGVVLVDPGMSAVVDALERRLDAAD